MSSHSLIALDLEDPKGEMEGVEAAPQVRQLHKLTHFPEAPTASMVAHVELIPGTRR